MLYPHKTIEKKGQAYWLSKKLFSTDLLDNKREKKYILAMFPYPSGSGLHVGHIRNYTIADVLARFYRSRGFNVFFPIGWDAFGLPAEQYAIKTNKHPAKFTQENINNFAKELKRMGYSYDGDKEINTSDEKYYHGTQGIFREMYQNKLAEFKQVPVYWCQKLATVLANEEIKETANGKVSERGEFPVEEKNIFQGILKITKYAEVLNNDLSELDGPKNIKTLQKNWIGIKQGNFVSFSVLNFDSKIEIFTTKIEAIKGVCALVVANENFLRAILKLEPSLKQKAQCFSGFYALNPLDNSPIPIGISDFAVENFGTGVVMISPIFSEKDKIFCEKMGINFSTSFKEGNKASDKELKFFLEKKKCGRKGVVFNLKDGIFSRQRYGGEPIPIIHGKDGGKEILAENELPLLLPDLEDFIPDEKYYAPLQKAKQGVEIEVENRKGERDINVMPQGAGSSGYYIAFLLRQKDSYIAINSREAKEILNKWLPVDIYIGGQEHSNSHLLYARFWHKFMKEINLFVCNEPFKKLICQGMILGKDGEKMSKSKGNVVNSSTVIEGFGADALRLYVIFFSPPEQTTNFDLNGVKAMRKGLNRVYKFFLDFFEYWKENEKHKKEDQIKSFDSYLIMNKEIEEFYEKGKLNLIVSSLMKFINSCYKLKKEEILIDHIFSFLKLLNPLAPHISEEIWSFGNENSINNSELIFERKENKKNKEIEKIKILIQINGKKKKIIEVEKGVDLNNLKKIVLQNEKINQIVSDSVVERIFFEKDKFINLVLNSKK